MIIKNGIVDNSLFITFDSINEFIKNISGIKQINGNLNLDGLNLSKLPDLSNIIVHGCFCCEDNLLINLIGCPKIINVNFTCYNNPLKSLEGCPLIVKGTSFFNKHVIIDKHVLNIIDSLSLDERYLTKKDCLPLLREIKLNKVLND